MEDWRNEKSQDSEVDLEEVDYAQVLQYMNHIMPVKAGRQAGGPGRPAAIWTGGQRTDRLVPELGLGQPR